MNSKDSRLRIYKNSGVGSEDRRKMKMDAAIELRKQKKEESLNKKRTLANTAPASPPHIQNSQCDSEPDFEVNLNYLPLIMENFQQLLNPEHNLETIYKSVLFIRKLLSKGTNPPISEIVNVGALPILVHLLSNNNSDIQFEAMWALTNIASGDSEETVAVTNAGALPHIINLLSSPHIHISEQAVWALGNIIGDSATLRDMVCQAGILRPLLELGKSSIPISFLRNIAWCISNLCRNKNPLPSIEVIQMCLPTITDFMQHSDVEVLADCCWALSYITDADSDRIQLVIEVGLVSKLAELLAHPNALILTPALRAIGNIATGSDSQTQAVIDSTVLSLFDSLLKNRSRSIIKEAAWMLSNIAAGSRNQIEEIFKHDLLQPILRVIHKGDSKGQREAAWVLINMTICGHDDILLRLLSTEGTISAICKVLSLDEPRLVHTLLQGLINILKVANDNGFLDDVTLKIEELEGLDKLESLQTHSNKNIYELSSRIIEDFFGVEDDSNEFGSVDYPSQKETGYEFNVPSTSYSNDVSGDAHPKPPGFSF